jgi:hypothetical protein
MRPLPDLPSRYANPIPGPVGPAGQPGAVGPQGPAGVNAFTALANSFSVPASGSNGTMTVGNTAWMVPGQSLFVRGCGYLSVVSITDSTHVVVQNTGVAGNAAPGTVIPVSNGVSPGGYAYVDNSQYTSLSGRVSALESATGFTTFYQSTAPTGTIPLGALWFNTADNYSMSRWDGTGWHTVDFTVTTADLATGLKAVEVVSSLPGSATEGDLAFNTTDGQLYRYHSGAWTNAVPAGSITGYIGNSQLAANSVAAGQIQAGVISATHVGANLLIANAANIQDGIITDAKISTLAASKIIAGIITSQIIQIAGGSGGAIRSSNYVSGSSGWNIDGSGNAEFSNATVRGTLAAGTIACNARYFNTGAPSSTFPSTAFSFGTVSPYAAPGTSGTYYSVCSMQGWNTGTGFATNKFGNATQSFIVICNGGGTPSGGSPSFIDLTLQYNINGGAWTQINPIAARCVVGNGQTLNVCGAVTISGLVGTETINFGVKAVGGNGTDQFNAAQVTVIAINA